MRLNFESWLQFLRSKVTDNPDLTEEKVKELVSRQLWQRSAQQYQQTSAGTRAVSPAPAAMPRPSWLALVPRRHPYQAVPSPPATLAFRPPPLAAPPG